MELSNEKKVSLITHNYLLSQLKILKQNDNLNDHKLIIKFETSLNKLQSAEKNLIRNNYIKMDNTWWKKYYKRNDYLKLKNTTLNRFIYFINN